MAGIQSGQQTRVVLVNGHTIILRGGSLNGQTTDVNDGLLQQALEDATGTDKLEDSSIESDINAEYGDANIDSADGKEPFLAVLQDNQGDTQTIQLTAEQATALGIHFTTDNDAATLSHLPDLSIDNGMALSGMSQMVYSDSVDQNGSEAMFECQDMAESLVMDEEIEQTMEDNREALDTSSLSSTTYNTINGNRQITLIPQMIGGQMTYTVKLPVDLDDSEEQFDDVDMPLVITEESASASLPSSGLKFLDITSTNRSKNMMTTTSYNTLPPLPSTVQSINSRNLKTVPVGTSLLNLKKPQVSYATVPLRSAVTNIGNPLNAPMKLINATTSRSLLQPDIFKTQSAFNTSTNTTFVTKTPITVPSTSQEQSVSSVLKPKYTSVLTTTSNNVSTSKVASISEKKSTTTLVPINIGKYTNVMASEGRLLTVPSTKTPNQMASDLSAALTKMPVQAINKSKPLGSSENPIQLVQHGQTFHSVQSLNQEQLKQIATVLQRQHLETPPRSTKKNMIYNAETNTRIIYRVVYPEDLDMKDGGSPKGGFSVRGRARRGRPPKTATLKGGLGRGAVVDTTETRVKVEVNLDEDRLNDDPKCDRKKQIARTRSGRVSRPPRHMVKDYKRLHHLDFAEPDLDDSDGGYSDYQTPEPDKEDVDRKPDGSETKPNELLSGLVSSKRKISSHFRCPTCQKIYLGHSRMSRHFEAYPDHETPREPEVAEEDVLVKSNGLVKTPAMRGRGKRRGPWTPEARSDRRKAKLREAIATCEAGELLEVAGPAVAGSVPLWQLVLLRVAAVRSGESCVATLCDELGALIEQVRSVSSEILRPCDEKDQHHEEIELQDKAVCDVLGLPCGRYLVNDEPLITSNIPIPNKRLKMDEHLEDVNSPPCPDVLSALTLVAKKSLAVKDDLPNAQPIEQDMISLSETAMHVNLVNASLNLPVVGNIAHDDLNIADFVHAPGTMNENSTSLDEANLMNSLEQFQSNTSKSVWCKEKEIDGEVFDPEIALEGDEPRESQLEYRNSELRLPSLQDDEAHGQFSVLDDSRGDDELEVEAAYDEDLALDSMEGEVGVVDLNQSEEFDPEMALAAMGEGEQGNTNNLSRVSYDPGVSLMEEDEIEYHNTINSSGSSYDPEIELSAMNDGNPRRDKVVDDSRTFPGLGLADVNSDESGPELDFEALSEEFNRNTSHES